MSILLCPVRSHGDHDSLKRDARTTRRQKRNPSSLRLHTAASHSPFQAQRSVASKRRSWLPDSHTSAQSHDCRIRKSDSVSFGFFLPRHEVSDTLAHTAYRTNVWKRGTKVRRQNIEKKAVKKRTQVPTRLASLRFCGHHTFGPPAARHQTDW
jgi:hypothetical protein